MSIEASNDDGADIFWPGFVDAVTNLVLNLLFMLTIMIVAVFMFALELSRHKDDDGVVNKMKGTVEDTVPLVESPLGDKVTKDEVIRVTEAKDIEIKALQKQVESLKQQVVVKNTLSNPQKVVIAKTPQAKAVKDLDKSDAAGGGVVVQFMLDAVTLSDAESETLRSTLAAIAAGGGARIEVVSPAGFTEAKRIGFYRAMAVRNQLIGMNVPADKIEVTVREGTGSADNTKVLVSPK